MAEIIPRGQIHLLKNVPLSPDYINTYWFASASQQYNYFQTQFSNVSFSNQYYQRKNRGWLRVEAYYKDVWNVSYMMFRNPPAHELNGSTVARPGYEDKWWYCFVDKIDYINDKVVEIHYTLDVIQSYMFNVSYEDTYVDRCTQYTDTAGDNLIDEGLPVGDYIYSNASALMFNGQTVSGNSHTLGDEMRPVIAATCDEQYKDTTDSTQEHPVHITTTELAGENTILLGCKMIDPERFPKPSTAQAWLANMPGAKQSAVLGIQMMPKVLADENHGTAGSQSVYADVYPRITTLGNYTPTNKKLLTAPFNTLIIQSSDGASVVYDPFLFTNPSTAHRFWLDYVFTFPLQGILYPQNYKNANPPTYALPLPNAPTCTWANDTFKAWAAMNTGYTALSIASSVCDIIGKVAITALTGMTAPIAAGMAGAGGLLGAGGAAGALPASTSTALSVGSSLPTASVGGAIPVMGTVTGGMGSTFGGSTGHITPGFDSTRYEISGGGIMGDLANIQKNIINVSNAKKVPDSFNGSAAGLAAIIAGNYGFFSAQRCIRADYAKQIDDYFTMFGYKQNKIMTISHDNISSPNPHTSLHTRQRFTYIKTSNMDIRGSIPAEDKALYCAIFDRGIRFWSDRENIGSYVSNNSLLT